MEALPIYDWFLEPVLPEDGDATGCTLNESSTSAEPPAAYFTVWGAREALEEASAGVPVRSLDPEMLWQTSVVVQVETDGCENTILRTESGSCYCLRGRLRAAHMVAAGWPAATVRAFQRVNNGKGTAFPSDWRRALGEGYSVWKKRREEVDLQRAPAVANTLAAAATTSRGPTLVVDESIDPQLASTNRMRRPNSTKDGSEPRANQIPPNTSREVRRLLEQLVRVRFHHPDIILGASSSWNSSNTWQAASSIVGAEVVALPPRSPTRRKRGRPRKQPLASDPSTDGSAGSMLVSQAAADSGPVSKSAGRLRGAMTRKTAKRSPGTPEAVVNGSDKDAKSPACSTTQLDSRASIRAEGDRHQADPARAEAGADTASISGVTAVPRRRGRPRKHSHPSADTNQSARRSRSARLASRKGLDERPSLASSTGTRSIPPTEIPEMTNAPLVVEAAEEPVISASEKPKNSKRVHFEIRAEVPDSLDVEQPLKHSASGNRAPSRTVEKALATLRHHGSGRADVLSRKQRAALRVVSEAATKLYPGDSIFVNDENAPVPFEAEETASKNNPGTLRSRQMRAEAWIRRGSRVSHEAYLSHLQRRRTATRPNKAKPAPSQEPLVAPGSTQSKSPATLDQWIHRTQGSDVAGTVIASLEGSDLDDDFASD